MYRQIILPNLPEVVGVTNGSYQVEINEQILEHHPNYHEINNLFLEPKMWKISAYNENVFKLVIEKPIRCKLLKGANMTDLMGFSPYFFGCNFIVSDRFVDCLLEFNVSLTEYRLFPIAIEGGSIVQYYILWTPIISWENINFAKSKLFLSKEVSALNKNYLPISSYGDYVNVKNESGLIMFDKISLNKRFSQSFILSIQAETHIYILDEIINYMSMLSLTNFKEREKTVDLIFD